MSTQNKSPTMSTERTADRSGVFTVHGVRYQVKDVARAAAVSAGKHVKCLRTARVVERVIDLIDHRAGFIAMDGNDPVGHRHRAVAVIGERDVWAVRSTTGNVRKNSCRRKKKFACRKRSNSDEMKMSHGDSR